MQWRILPAAPPEFFLKLPRLNPVIVQLLYNRGLAAEEAENFLAPDYLKHSNDPFLFGQMETVLERIRKAVSGEEPVAIYGDFDTDGVCSSAILAVFFRDLGLKFSVTMPDRRDEGHGLKNHYLEEIAQSGARAVFVLDCGLSDVAEVEYANSRGMDVIIIDHHSLPDKLPSAFAVINPKQEVKYPFNDLSAAGVVFKVVQAYHKKHPDVLSRGYEKWLLDLVALATVGDCMPLLGENRVFVKYGLLVLAQTRRAGLKELMKQARIEPVFERRDLSTNLDSDDIGFYLAPRLNAASRMAHASIAYEALVTDDAAEAAALARHLEEKNRERQILTDKIFNIVCERVKNSSSPIIFEGDKDWSGGIIGLVAGKAVDKFHKPTFIYQIKDNQINASARSIPEFRIDAALKKCHYLFIGFGGHAGAGGFRAELKNTGVIKKCLEEEAAKIAGSGGEKHIDIETSIAPEEIDWPFFKELEKFHPFGTGNEEPVFLTRGLVVASSRGVGQDGKHWQLRFISPNLPGRVFRGISFGDGFRAQEFLMGEIVDAVYTLNKEEWNGRKDLTMKVVDIKKSNSNLLIF